MTAAETLGRCQRLAVSLVAAGDQLRASAQPGVLTPELVADLRRHKAEILRMIRCRQHVEPADWLDEQAAGRPGWVRTTCRRCGAFIGWRPADNESD